MANWCNNVVWFEANETTMQKIKEMFLRMAQKEKETDCGQLPSFVKDDKDWFFAIRWEAEDVLYYDTKWSPNIEIVRQIADHYNVGFTSDYEELGCLVYGKATYADGILTDTYLEQVDFNTYQSDEETDTYLFEGETYDSEWEILETLLERKIANRI
ncbi:DUF1281 family ferredoxin-like fold protein [Elizabethkingia anophelis]|uniref:DUF1281 family ferredoxin-like fold protein n=1 Tax=Elizabethkingia anophelis TaxID=1117645 RepID=UPI001626B397|nr:hypothetical protein [Elizabethkingia anophelis]MDV4116245.1 hypothetical protein [Elizabethkingia anophelis]